MVAGRAIIHHILPYILSVETFLDSKEIGNLVVSAKELISTGVSGKSTKSPS